jgi:hypothetical protein
LEKLDGVETNRELAISSNKKKMRAIWEFLKEQWIKLRYLMLDGEMLYFLLFTSCSLLSFFNRFFYAFLLLDVFWRFPTLT